MQRAAYDRYISADATALPANANAAAKKGFAAGVLITAKNLQVADHLRNLYAHLLENHSIDCIVGFDPDILDIFSRDVLRRIAAKDASWESMVPPTVATTIKARKLFGYAP